MRRFIIAGMLVVGLSALVVVPGRAEPGATCCDYSSDCPEGEKCCYGRLACSPNSGEAYCVDVDTDCSVLAGG